MIANAVERHRAGEELRAMQDRLRRLQQANSPGSKRLVEAGVRKMIARLREELSAFADGERAE